MSFDDEYMISPLRRRTNEMTTEITVLSRYEAKNLFYLKKKDDYNFIKHRLEFMKSGYLELLNIENFYPINTLSTNDIYTFGFIVLASNKIFIFNNIDGSNDVLVELRLSELDRYSLFPGQVVAIKGCNPNGHEIIVHEIYDSPVLSINFHDDNGSLCKQHTDDFFSVCFLSGPFNGNITEELYISPNVYDMFFLCLDNLLNIEADFLVLLGPFIESRFLNSYLDIKKIEEIFVSKLKQWADKNPNRKIITIPSSDDAQTLGIYPGSPLSIYDIAITNLSNPVLFYIKNTLFGISTHDILLQISSTEIYHDNDNCIKPESNNKGINTASAHSNVSSDALSGSEKKTRIERLMAHLIYQRTFLPCFPSKGVISISQPESFDMEITPDFLIVNSRLKTFVQKDKGPFIVANIGHQSDVVNKQFLKLVIKNNKYDIQIGKLQK